jgi:Mce-associated membrane protein
VANPISRGRGSGSPARRTLTAAARAAAKRAESVTRDAGDRGRTESAAEAPSHPKRQQLSGGTPERQPSGGTPERQPSGRTLLIEAPDGWDDPPEPSPEAFAEDLREGQEPGADAATRRRGRRLLVAVLAVALVAGLVAVAVLGWRYREGRQAEQARGQALAAARQAAPVVLSYDYRHVDQDFAAARAHLTGHFRDEYAKTTKTVVGPTAKKYRGVVKATVVEPSGGGAPAASVVSASPDRAVVLLFVNQVTRSTQVSGSRVDLNRVRMTLSRTSEGWKVSAVDAL